MLRLIYLLLVARLKTLTLPGPETPLLKEVTWFTNQYDLREPEKQIMAVPACYIEFMDASFSSNSGGGQYLPQSFRLHIVTQLGGMGQLIAPVSSPLAHHQIVDAVYAGIQGFKGKASDIPVLADLLNTPQDFQVLNSCNRDSINPDYDGGHIITTILTFKTLAFDPAAIKHYSSIAATLNVSATFNGA
jgi:hypothetical protein